MAPTTIKMDTQANAPSPQGLVRLTTFGGTELNLLGGQDSPKPVFIRGAPGHFEPQVDLDSEPAKLDIPWPAFFVGKKPQAPSVALETSDEFACHTSQCSTKDPDEMPAPVLSPQGALVAAGLLECLGVPTKGSTGHMIGKCRPCAFVFKDGCGSGVNCEFCHLCQPGEQKRRKREREKRLIRQRELKPNARTKAQCAELQARSYAQAHQNPYVPSNEVCYVGYQGW
jgi:hypothetical protein